ncbi:uncharacterized protein LOC128549515 [Mercenaria mercenaria]|uniref:uncharacterized protein LOC128549515 n=1 Tax=Mercenaria mercenaria TaxID=6596 RepID=UPI00234F3456|nr:uncharacterized protein LOC128549515 [Mercenaria mercenaria]
MGEITTGGVNVSECRESEGKKSDEAELSVRKRQTKESPGVSAKRVRGDNQPPDNHQEEGETDTEESRRPQDNILRGYSVAQADRVLLNIGGTHFETTIQNLTIDPKCIFALAINNGELTEMKTLTFDRDPTHFRHVLNHLRNRMYTDMRTLPNSISQLLECLQEAQYYALESLQRAVVAKLEQLTVVSPLVLPTWTSYAATR